MSTTHDLPSSGYALVKVFATQHELHPKSSSETDNPGGLSFGWDWRFLKSPTNFEVRLSLSLEPSEGRSEFVMTDVVGRFRRLQARPKVKVEDFANLQAVAILLPYARQFLSALTVNSRYGAYYLPSLNVSALMRDFDPANTTAFRQQSEKPQTTVLGHPESSLQEESAQDQVAGVEEQDNDTTA